jgi:large subunit ribosomal protein L6e
LIMPRITKNPNPFISNFVTAFSRSAAKRRKGYFKKASEWKPQARSVALTKEPKVKVFNKTETRVISSKAPKFYSEEAPRKRLHRNFSNRPTRLRKSLKPGSIVIILQGPFKGRKAVFLKQLQPSGLLLITGPYKINGVPLRRINQRYVIATSTRVNLKGVKLDSKFDDKYFKKGKKEKKSKDEATFFKDRKNKTKKTGPFPYAGRKQDQKDVDKQVLAGIKQVPLLRSYIRTHFSLKKGQYPHNMKF